MVVNDFLSTFSVMFVSCVKSKSDLYVDHAKKNYILNVIDICPVKCVKMDRKMLGFFIWVVLKIFFYFNCIVQIDLKSVLTKL